MTEETKKPRKPASVTVTSPAGVQTSVGYMQDGDKVEGLPADEVKFLKDRGQVK